MSLTTNEELRAKAWVARRYVVDDCWSHGEIQVYDRVENKVVAVYDDQYPAHKRSALRYAHRLNREEAGNGRGAE